MTCLWISYLWRSLTKGVRFRNRSFLDLVIYKRQRFSNSGNKHARRAHLHSMPPICRERRLFWKHPLVQEFLGHTLHQLIMSSAGTAQIKRLFQLSNNLQTRQDTHPPTVYPRGADLGGSWGPFFSHPRFSKALGLSGECQESPGKQPPPHRAEPTLGRVPAIEACIACSDTSCHAQLLEQPVRVCAPLCTPTSPIEDTPAHTVRCSLLCRFTR
jgi:hypothetical protein